MLWVSAHRSLTDTNFFSSQPVHRNVISTTILDRIEWNGKPPSQISINQGRNRFFPSLGGRGRGVAATYTQSSVTSYINETTSNYTVCKWDTPGPWNIDPFRLLILKNLEADNKTQYLLQNPYMHSVFTLLVVYCIQVLKCRMTPPRNSAHQCLVTKINTTILHLIRNPIFKERSFECIGNFRRLISTC